MCFGWGWGGDSEGEGMKLPRNPGLRDWTKPFYKAPFCVLEGHTFASPPGILTVLAKAWKTCQGVVPSKCLVACLPGKQEFLHVPNLISFLKCVVCTFAYFNNYSVTSCLLTLGTFQCLGDKGSEQNPC